ncbi:hypothetical protein LINPERPRIM_LOCUS2262, partial [Linum perenne]
HNSSFNSQGYIYHPIWLRIRTQPLKVGPVQPRRPEGQFRNLENFIFLFVILGFMSSSVKPPSSAKPPSSVKPPQRRLCEAFVYFLTRWIR